MVLISQQARVALGLSSHWERNFQRVVWKREISRHNSNLSIKYESAISENGKAIFLHIKARESPD